VCVLCHAFSFILWIKDCLNCMIIFNNGMDLPFCWGGLAVMYTMSAVIIQLLFDF
jgi:hypothetical protein